MIKTITTGSCVSIQGVLVKLHGVRNFQTGEFEPNGLATVSDYGTHYTGRLVTPKDEEA